MSSYCPANQVYLAKTAACPKTCSTINKKPDCDGTIEGCGCPEGQILKSNTNNTCVNIAECPCIYGSKIFNSGDKLRKECSEW